MDLNEADNQCKMIVSRMGCRKLSVYKTYSIRDCIFIKAFMIWAMVFRSCSATSMYVVVEAKCIFVSSLFQYSLRFELGCSSISQGHYIVLLLTASHMWEMLLGVFD